METNETYEIERLEIKLFKTDALILNKKCGKYENEDVYVTVNCEINLQGNGYIKNVLRSNMHKKHVKLTVKCTVISAYYKHFFK